MKLKSYSTSIPLQQGHNFRSGPDGLAGWLWRRFYADRHSTMYSIDMVQRFLILPKLRKAAERELEELIFGDMVIADAEDVNEPPLGTRDSFLYLFSKHGSVYRSGDVGQPIKEKDTRNDVV